jgi:hypothetical protein
MRRVVLAVLPFLFVGELSAQQVRGSLSSLARYIEIRPIVADTVDIALTTIDDNGRPIFEGRPVFCAAQTCTFYRPADMASAVALSHDLAATAFGFGVEGASAVIYLRARQDLGGDFVWPRSDDAFDAVLAYAELAREDFRVRLGRQRNITGLGFNSFDGLSGTYQALDALRVEAYGGRSLARALEEPHREALGPVESFIPDNNAWLFGAAAELNANQVAGSLRYQREIWGDRAALVSERAAIDVRSNAWRWASIEAAADYDVAYNRLGKAHLSLRRQLFDNELSVDVTARRYLPFFELWTIWGAFSPVPYHEFEAGAGWRANQRTVLDARAGYRRYSDTDAEVFIAPAADESWRLTLRARRQLSDPLTIDAEYRVETGFGAFLSSGEASVAWAASERLQAGIYGTAFQQILEFRTGEAAVFGLGAHVEWQITSALTATGQATLYRQSFDNRPSALNWTQKRASLGVEWSFGRDPGVAQ